MNITILVRKLPFVFAVLIICSQVVHARQSLDKIVAVVNDDVISQSELDKYTSLVTAEMSQKETAELPAKSELQLQLLKRLILDKIQLQLATQAGIDVDSMTVSQTLQHMAQQHGISLETFKHDIEARGITFSEYRELIKHELTIQSLQGKEVAQEVSIAKTDIESYLNSAAGQDQSGTEYRLSHILLLTSETPTPEALKHALAQSEELVKNLRSGADFNKLAMSKSAGRQALKGGDLGWRPIGELPTLFVTAVPKMKVGDIVGPIRSASGFHIIKLQDKRTAAEETRTETHVRQILIRSDEKISNDEAKDIIAGIKQQIIKGTDFAKLASEKSQDTRTASKGGDMGWVNQQAVLPKFYAVMAKLGNHEISEPFLTEEGWNLIQVLDRRSQRTSNEAAWNKAREILTLRKTNEAIEAWMTRIREEARVEILIPEDSKPKTT